jgi:hypothetical protein
MIAESQYTFLEHMWLLHAPWAAGVSTGPAHAGRLPLFQQGGQAAKPATLGPKQASKPLQSALYP